MNSLMIAVSMGLQYGVPPEVYVSKLSHMRFEPSGTTNDVDIRVAKSIVDYIFRWFGKKFLTVEQQEEVGILSPEVKARLAAGVRGGRGSGSGGGRPAAAAPQGQTALFNAFEDARVLPLRRPDDPDGQLLHVPRLRHEHRLLLAGQASCRAGAHVMSTQPASGRPQGRPEWLFVKRTARKYDPPPESRPFVCSDTAVAIEDVPSRLLREAPAIAEPTPYLRMQRRPRSMP